MFRRTTENHRNLIIQYRSLKSDFFALSALTFVPPTHLNSHHMLPDNVRPVLVHMQYLTLKDLNSFLDRVAFLLLRWIGSDLVGWDVLDFKEEMKVLPRLFPESRFSSKIVSDNIDLADLLDPQLSLVPNEHVGYGRADWRPCLEISFVLVNSIVNAHQ